MFGDRSPAETTTTTTTTMTTTTSTFGPSLSPILADNTTHDLGRGYSLQRSLGTLRISRRIWRSSPTVWFFIPFILFWDSVLAAFIISGELPILFWFTHGIPGVVIPYYLLVAFTSKQRITISHGHLEVKTGPLPWFGNRLLAVRDLLRLDVTDSGTKVNGRPLTDVVAVERSGKRTVLVTVRNQRDGEMIERLVEEHLGLDGREKRSALHG